MKMGRERLVRYCIACGLTFILIVVIWSQIYRLDFIKNGIVEMENITDDVIRRREFYWLGQITTLTAAIGAGIFAVVFYVTEEFFLGPRPKKKEQQENQKRLPKSARMILCFVVVTFIGGTRSLWALIYFIPWVFFLFVLLCFVLRLLSRTDYFPPKNEGDIS